MDRRSQQLFRASTAYLQSWPKQKYACRAAAASFALEFGRWVVQIAFIEQLLDLRVGGIEIGREPHFPLELPELARFLWTPRYRSLGRHGRDDLHQRLAVLGDDDLFAARGVLDQLGEPGLGFVEGDLARHTGSLRRVGAPGS